LKKTYDEEILIILRIESSLSIRVKQLGIL